VSELLKNLQSNQSSTSLHYIGLREMWRAWSPGRSVATSPSAGEIKSPWQLFVASLPLACTRVLTAPAARYD
jgi:hypothetical protein